MRSARSRARRRAETTSSKMRSAVGGRCRPQLRAPAPHVDRGIARRLAGFAGVTSGRRRGYPGNGPRCGGEAPRRQLGPISTLRRAPMCEMTSPRRAGSAPQTMSARRQVDILRVPTEPGRELVTPAPVRVDEVRTATASITWTWRPRPRRRNRSSPRVSRRPRRSSRRCRRRRSPRPRQGEDLGLVAKRTLTSAAIELEEGPHVAIHADGSSA